MSDAKERIRERLDIVEVVGELVPLKPAGRGQFKGLCPFHDEKTPSFHVHRDKGFFYCFGCGAKGDLFDFVMRTRSVPFVDALKLLGERAGVPVDDLPSSSKQTRDLRDLVEFAFDRFKGALEGAPLDYLLGRGLTGESIDAFGLGYAPDEWDWLLTAATSKGFRADDLVKVGLVVENERGRRYDRFRGRVIFPIRDALSRLVGFAGRGMGDAQPKYLNSPESELFHKGELLYGLDRARSAIRESGEAVVVEGYMDVIALHQAGFGNAVASLGTALTEGHVAALERVEARRLYLAFDTDEAGQRATLAGLDQAAARRFLVSAVTTPHGKDPAEAVLGGHADDFRTALAHGMSEVEYRFGSVTARHDPSTLDGQRAVLDELAGVLVPRDIFDPVASEMRRLVCARLDLDPARLDDWLARAGRRRSAGSLGETELRGMRKRRVELEQAVRLELEIAALLLLEPGRLEGRLARVVNEVEIAEAPTLGRFALLAEQVGYDDEELLARYVDAEEGAVLFERLFDSGDMEGVRIDVDDQLTKALSLLREYKLEGLKEESRARLAARRRELQSSAAGAPGDAAGSGQEGEALTAGLASELEEIQAVLAARDAERRLRVPVAHARKKRR